MNHAPLAPQSTPPPPHWRQRLVQRLRTHLPTLLMLLAIVVGAHLWHTRHLPRGVVPDATVQLASGETMPLSRWRALHPGQPVALHFWAEWCPICRTEEHSVTRVQRDWPVLTVAMQSGAAPKVLQVLAQRALPWTTAVDTNGALARSMGVQSVPALLVLDASGQLRAASVGYTSEIGMRLRLRWAQAMSGWQ